MNGCIYRTEDNKCEFWSDYGKGIVSYCDFDDCEEKKPTNADRIRAMTDEELATEIVKCRDADDFRKTVLGTRMNTTEEWLDWLKSPVEVDE